MKPTVIANANAAASTGAGPGNGITIPINREYSGPPQPPQHYQQSQQHPQYYNTQGQHYVGADPHTTAYGSPGSHARVPQQQQQPPHPHSQQQQIPAHFQQDFDFDTDMFPRSRIGRMAHDPFADFGASHFGFPQFNSLGRRRTQNPHNDDDFFNRLPSEFRQYIPDSFGHRRTVPTAAAAAAATAPGTGMAGSPGPQVQAQVPPHFYQTMPQSPSKKVCDAAIQTEDPNAAGRSEVDHAVPSDNLNQHGLRNTMDMGVKSAAENDNSAFRSHSAPPPEQQQPYLPQQQIPINGQRPMHPSQQQHPQQGSHPQFGTQTSPPVQGGVYAGQPPQFQKAYYAPQQSSHPQQQKQQTPPPPQTPGGTYIRTIPIFVEGRSEPIINHKEIPNQNAAPNANTGRAYTPPRQQQQQPSQQQQQQQQQQPQQQQHRPAPLNTQNQQAQQQQTPGAGLPPQTPHTVDSINKIQDIQRDVLDLMTRVEQFTGTRSDKDYAYLDEMLTRNLLKLDNIDTNGKESIRLARKEAIKCIQASINVLEAKAEDNKRAAQAAVDSLNTASPAVAEGEIPQKSNSGAKVTKDPSQPKVGQDEEEPADAKNIQEPIPLPPPEGMMANTSEVESTVTAESTQEQQEAVKEPSPPAAKNAAEEPQVAEAESTESSAIAAETK